VNIFGRGLFLSLIVIIGFSRFIMPMQKDASTKERYNFSQPTSTITPAFGTSQPQSLIWIPGPRDIQTNTYSYEDDNDKRRVIEVPPYHRLLLKQSYEVKEYSRSEPNGQVTRTTHYTMSWANATSFMNKPPQQ
jgi:hypothetical protein